AAPEIDPETYAAVDRAIKAAVQLINADKRKYLHYFIEDIPPESGALTAEDFRLSRLRYVDPTPYPADEFKRGYQWMLSWNLIRQDAAFDQIVDNRISAAV